MAQLNDLLVLGLSSLQGSLTVGDTIFSKNNINFIKGSYSSSVAPLTLTANRTLSLPDVSGVVATIPTSGTAVGSGTKPIYFTGAGVATASASTVGANTANAAKPIFMNAGTLTALSVSSGATDRPTYLNAGAITPTTYRMASTNVTATTALAITSDLPTGIWYVSGTSDILGQTDGVCIANQYSSSQISEIYQDYRTGQLAVRGKNNGTWQAWRKILDNSNYSTTLDTRYVTLGTEQTISGKKTFTGSAKISGRYIGSGDDEGLIIGRADNEYAGVILGEPSGVRSVFYLLPSSDGNTAATWRFNNGSASYDIKHPCSAGTIALTNTAATIALTGNVTGSVSGSLAGGWSINATCNYAATAGSASSATSSTSATNATNASKVYVNNTTANNTYYIVGALGQTAGNADIYRAYNASGTANKTGIYFNGSTGVLYGAAWNDYAEFRKTKENIEAGRVVIETGKGDLILSAERLQPGVEVVSDTFGFAIGESENCKTPIAVSGRVLVYPNEDRNTYQPGDAVCSGPNGTVSKMTREEIKEYPERIIGTVSEIPEYEIWGESNVEVKNRIWIRIR